MMFPEGLELYTAMLVTVAFLILFTFIGLVYDECKESKKKDTASHAPQPQRDAQKEEVEEPPEEPEHITIVIPDPSPAEVALLAANRQSFQMNLDMVEAQHFLAEAARRHELDPTPAAWYKDAEWDVLP